MGASSSEDLSERRYAPDIRKCGMGVKSSRLTAIVYEQSTTGSVSGASPPAFPGLLIGLAGRSRSVTCHFDRKLDPFRTHADGSIEYSHFLFVAQHRLWQLGQHVISFSQTQKKYWWNQNSSLIWPFRSGGTQPDQAGSQEMERLLIIGFMLITGAALGLIYIARPSETAQEFAQRICNRERESGVTMEKCLEARKLQYLASRRE